MHYFQGNTVIPSTRSRKNSLKALTFSTSSVYYSTGLTSKRNQTAWELHRALSRYPNSHTTMPWFNSMQHRGVAHQPRTSVEKVSTQQHNQGKKTNQPTNQQHETPSWHWQSPEPSSRTPQCITAITNPCGLRRNAALQGVTVLPSPEVPKPAGSTESNGTQSTQTAPSGEHILPSNQLSHLFIVSRLRPNTCFSIFS